MKINDWEDVAEFAVAMLEYVFGRTEAFVAPPGFFRDTAMGRRLNGLREWYAAATGKGEVTPLEPAPTWLPLRITGKRPDSSGGGGEILRVAADGKIFLRGLEIGQDEDLPKAIRRGYRHEQ